MIRQFIFIDKQDVFKITPSEATRGIVLALSRILWKLAGEKSRVSVVSCSTSPCTMQTPAEHFQIQELLDFESTAKFISDRSDMFAGDVGVLLFVFSALLTKGVDIVKSEMDDPGSTLTVQFGHCSQELLNLLICGQAVSNVFDGEVPFGGETADDSGLMLRGIPHKCDTGYLTHLEALRYCQVGTFYKQPSVPIWVVGSSQHFSVLFSASLESNTKSEAEETYDRVQRAFKAKDPQENGYIQSTQLGEVRSSCPHHARIHSALIMPAYTHTDTPTHPPTHPHAFSLFLPFSLSQPPPPSLPLSLPHPIPPLTPPHSHKDSSILPPPSHPPQPTLTLSSPLSRPIHLPASPTQVLKELNSPQLEESVLSDATGGKMGLLHEHLEISGAGIILWDDLWKVLHTL
jgi:hypothetical protein